MLRIFTSKFPLRPHMLRSGLLLAAAAPLLFAAPVAAQSSGDAARLERVETQLRALQRAVFPGGDQRFFEPEITPQQPVVNAPNTGVGTTALTDVLARLDALESQLARLTAATEVNQNALTTLEARLAAVEREAVVAGASGALPPASGVILTPSVRPVNTPTPGPVTIPTPTPRPTPAPTPALAPLPAATPAPAEASGPTAARLAGVRAILKPQTAEIGRASCRERVYGTV